MAAWIAGTLSLAVGVAVGGLVALLASDPLRDLLWTFQHRTRRPQDPSQDTPQDQVPSTVEDGEYIIGSHVARRMKEDGS